MDSQGGAFQLGCFHQDAFIVAQDLKESEKMKYLISYQLDQIQQKGFKNIEFLLKEKKLKMLFVH